MALLALVTVALPAGTAAEQASQPGSPAAGQLDVSGAGTPGDTSGHTCARLPDRALRCWGFGGAGRLGYGNEDTIGDNETPGAVAPVDLGDGLTAEAVSAGAYHTCGLLNDGSVRCWGFGGEGRLGYANTNTIGDDEKPGESGPVELGQRAKAISAGGGHTCAVLDDDSVRCWGFGRDGRLGYGTPDDPETSDDESTVGNNETPASAGPVDLGEGRSAEAISAGDNHTCAVLDGGDVRCWGNGLNGQLGYGNPDIIGNDEGETPGKFGPVDLRSGRAVAITAGDDHTCALLDNGDVFCWGYGGNGQLGYGNTDTIGDNEKPGDRGPVDLGQGAKAISAGDNHTCAILADDSVRCWGFGANGRLGYANTEDIGDDPGETPGSAAPVDLGPERTAAAISAGGHHTCALLDDAGIRCWGLAATGRLGYCNANDVGDDETPGSAGPVNVTGSSGCPPPSGPAPPPGLTPVPAPGVSPAPETGDGAAARRRERYRRAFAAQARRKRALRSCLRRAARRSPRPTRRMRPAERRAARRRCLRRHGRTPGRVGKLTARGISRKKIVLSFNAAGTHGRRPPAARTYVVKQSRTPIRGKRGFRRAQTLCRGKCRFDVTFVGAKVDLTIEDLIPATTYHYAVAARDNVSGRVGRHSPTAKARTRR